jgi:hypothetical protein
MKARNRACRRMINLALQSWFLVLGFLLPSAQADQTPHQLNRHLRSQPKFQMVPPSQDNWCGAADNNEPLLLWYRQPAKQWVEALPVGNGRLGAMVFGGINNERIELNEDTLWAGGPYDPTNPEALKALPEARRLILE